ncbi:MAG: DUF6531 domain-containing protein [Planctomycetota bacterium]
MRGDCDQNLRFDITDPITGLSYLFLGTDEPVCLDACDVDDDDELAITDAIFSLSFLFLGGPPPAPPYPLEGVDPEGAGLSCENGRAAVAELFIAPPSIVFHDLEQIAWVALRARFADGSDRELGGDDRFQFRSEDPSIVEVDAEGRVVAKGVGRTRVFGTFQSVDVACDVEVLGGADGAPRVRILAPRDGTITAAEEVTISAWVSDTEANLSFVGGDGETRPVRAGERRGNTITLDAELSSGANELAIVARRDELSSRATIRMERVTPGAPDALGPDGRPFPVIPPRRAVGDDDTTPPEVSILEPKPGTQLNSAYVDVVGRVNDPNASVRVRGVAAEIDGDTFRVEELWVGSGDQTIEAVAVDRHGNEASADVSITVSTAAPRLTVDLPIGERVLYASRDEVVLVRGSVDPASARVLVGEVEATKNGAAYSATIPLDEGLHDLVVTAVDENDPQIRTQVVRALYVDRTRPRLDIHFPTGPRVHRTRSSMITIAGQAFDPGAPIDLDARHAALEVRVGDAPPVSVHDLFRVPIALAPGRNEIPVSVTDARGWSSSQTVVVERALGSGLEIVQGDAQSVVAGEAYAQPLRVRAVDAAGSPLVGISLRFQIVVGAGRFTAGSRQIDLATDAVGDASVTLEAGLDAGLGASGVLVSRVDGEGSPAYFALDVVPVASRALVALTPRRTQGLNARILSRSLAARLIDGEGNAIAGGEVEFVVASGRGLFGAGATETVTTDAIGAARVDFGLSPVEQNEVVVEARSAGTEPVRFTIEARELGAPRDTGLAGVLLDDMSQPIAGAAISITSDPAQTQTTTDASGSFLLPETPIGEVLLDVEVASGETRRFLASTYSGTLRVLDTPLRMPREDPRLQRSVRIDEVVSGVLRLPGLPGLRVELPAASVRFANGDLAGSLRATRANERVAAIAFPDATLPGALASIEPRNAGLVGEARVSLPNGHGEAGARRRIYERCAPCGAWLEGAMGIVSTDEARVDFPAASVRRLGVRFASKASPSRARRVDVEGSVGTIVPYASEVPQHERSHVLGHQVYAHSGEFYLDEVDLELPARSLEYRFRRRYESRHLFRGSLGWNWEHEYADRRLRASSVAGNVIRANGFGRFDEYMLDPASGRFVSPLSRFSRLFVLENGDLIEREPDGLRYRYHPLDGSPLSGRLLEISDRRGDRMSLEYDDLGRLERVIDPFGRAVSYFYDGEDRIEEIVDFAGRRVGFAYDANGDLVSVTRPAVTGTPTNNNFPDGKTCAYVYSSGFEDRRLNHNLLEVIDPREVAAGTRRPRLRNVYIEDESIAHDRIAMQISGGTNDTGVEAGGEYEFSYESIAPLGDRFSGLDLESTLLAETVQTSQMDPQGVQTDVRSSAAGLPTSVRTFTKSNGPYPRSSSNLRPALGIVPPWYEARFEWDVESRLLARTDPSGGRTEWTYDIAAPLRSSRGLVSAETRFPEAGSEGSDPEVTTRRFDPVFAREVGSLSPSARGDEVFATRKLLDYQEGTDVAALAAELGAAVEDVEAALAHAGVEMNLGDLNGDGVTEQRSGSVVSEILPPPDLAAAKSEERAQRTSRYNSFGQPIWHRDAVGLVTTREYYPASDPNGDGVDVVEGQDGTSGGFLRAITRDAERDDESEPLAIVTRYEYDAIGFVRIVIDPRGNRFEYVRNALGQVVEYRVPAPLRYRRRFHYDHDDRLVRLQVENFGASDANVPQFVIDNSWIETEFDYDLLGRVVERRREISEGEVGEAKILVETYRYDASGRLVRRVRGEAPPEEWSYDERGLPWRHLRGPDDFRPIVETRFYDLAGRVALIRDAEDSDDDGRVEETEQRYDGFGRLVATIDPVRAEVLERGVGGAVTSRVELDRDGRVLLSRSRFEYDARGRRTRAARVLFGEDVETRSLIEEFGYDDEDRLVSKRLPDGSEHVIDRDLLGQARRETLASGVVVERDFDVAGNLVEESRTGRSELAKDPASAGAVGFDGEGYLLDVRRYLHAYDILDRRVVTVDDSGGTWRARYDSLDRLITVSDTNGPAVGAAADRETVALARRMTQEQQDAVNGHGNRTRYVYDNIGRLVRTVYELRREGSGGGALDATNSFNIDGLVSVGYEWTDDGRLFAWTNDSGRRTIIGYDSAGRARQKIWPNGAEETFQVDNDGDVRRIIDRNGSVIEQIYDAGGRLVSRFVSRGAAGGEEIGGTVAQHFGYDALSRVTYSIDLNTADDGSDDAIVRSTYDSLGRLTSEEQNGFRFEFEYDDLGRRVAIRYPDAFFLQTPRDASGKVRALDDGVRRFATIENMNSGLFLEKELASGVRLSRLDVTEEGTPRFVGYDELGNVTERIYVDRTGGELFNFEYGRDPNGHPLFERQVHRMGAPGDVWRYDSLSRITQYQPQVFDPRVPPIDPVEKVDILRDGDHNWRVVEVDQSFRSIEVDSLNRFRIVNGESLQYDPGGNLRRFQSRNLVYDGLDRLIRVEIDGTVVARYTYDAHGAHDARDFRGLGRRTSKSFGEDEVRDRRYTYVGSGLVEERDASGRTLRQYAYEAPGLATLLRVHVADDPPGIYDLVRDERGNVAAVLDQSHAKIEEFRYGVHGLFDRLNVFNNPIPESPVGQLLYFGGMVWDRETGFYSNGARTFFPGIGRYLSDASTFAIEHPFGLNGYLSPRVPGLVGDVIGRGSSLRERPELSAFRDPVDRRLDDALEASSVPSGAELRSAGKFGRLLEEASELRMEVAR